MVWTKSISILVTTLMVTNVYGNDEPLWRVQNNIPGKIVEAYNNESTPFTISKRTIKQINIAKRSGEELSVQRKGRQATKILTEIRKILNSNQVLAPNISDVVVSAKMAGYDGDSILVNNRWLRTGDELLVAPRAEQALYDLLEEIEGVDTRLSAIVEEQIMEKVEQAEKFSLKVGKIGTQSVVMIDKDGTKHVINLAVDDEGNINNN